MNPAIFDFLFVSCSIFAVILPNPEQLEATPKVVVEQLRGGESSKNLNFAQKFVSFFIPSLYKPQPQCPALPQTSRTASLKFASGNGGGNGGDGSNSRSQNIPPSDKWESDEDFYKDFQRYQNRKNKNKDDEIETCDLEVRTVNEENLSYSSVKRITKTALMNNDVKKDYQRIKTRLENGVHPKDINSKKSGSLGNNFYLIKGSEGRYVVEYKGDDVVNVVGIADRGNKKNIKSLKKAMKDLYGINLKYTKF